MTTRSATLGIALIATLAAQQAAPAAASTLGRLTFSAAVPRAGGSLPLYRLSRTNAPTAFVAGVLGASGGPTLAVEGRRFVARDGSGVARAYTDPVRGDAQIFPDLTAKGGSANPALSTQAAAAVFGRSDIIPADATTSKIVRQTTITSADATNVGGQTQSTKAPSDLFTYVAVQRFAAGLRVYGIGSKAVVGIGPDGSVRALVRRWESARQAGAVAPSTTPAQVIASIRNQTTSYLAHGDNVNVEHIERAYYDGDANYLQPIYFFIAGVRSPDGIVDHVTGYVPFGAEAETIPALNEAPGAMPTTFGGNSGAQPNGSQISLGEYANDDGQTVGQGNYLLYGLQTYSGGIYGPAINRTQYYWATPADYVGSSAMSYINAVQVAHTPPHGNWWLNTTDSNDAGFFYINNIGTGGNPGYGHAAGGKLVTWIMDSCENAPSYYDLQVTTGNGNNAFNNWWPVFQGMHHLLAYRTMMFINQWAFDQQFGEDAEIGTNIGSAWYNDDASWYSQYSSDTYLDTNINQYVHYGNVSIFQDKRNLNESIYNVQNQSASGSMNNSWMSN